MKCIYCEDNTEQKQIRADNLVVILSRCIAKHAVVLEWFSNARLVKF